MLLFSGADGRSCAWALTRGTGVPGESGAGKTETAKRFLQYLAYAATRGANSSSHGLEERVLATSPLLEAMGNSQTAHIYAFTYRSLTLTLTLALPLPLTRR